MFLQESPKSELERPLLFLRRTPIISLSLLIAANLIRKARSVLIWNPMLCKTVVKLHMASNDWNDPSYEYSNHPSLINGSS